MFLALSTFGSISTAAAPVGKTPADAMPIPSSGRFAGIVWPSSSMWFEFTYVGGQNTTVWVAYLPTDSTSTDLGLYSGTRTTWCRTRRPPSATRTSSITNSVPMTAAMSSSEC